jgi:hypothetical protein
MTWFCRSGLATMALLLFALAGPAAAAAKRVVLRHSFGQDFKHWSKYARATSQRTEAVGASLLDTLSLQANGARSPMKTRRSSITWLRS